MTDSEPVVIVINAFLHLIDCNVNGGVRVFESSAQLRDQVYGGSGSLWDVAEHAIESDEELNVFAGLKLSNELDLHDLGKVQEDGLIIVALSLDILLDV